jgi:hypothetical protein
VWRQRFAGDADDRGVRLAAGQRVEQFVVVLLAEDDLDRGVDATELTDADSVGPALSRLMRAR